MWFRAVRRHCSGETLLAYADGELSRRKARRVRKHLSACWNCRARLQEVEQQVQLLARASNAPNLPDEDLMAKARNRLFQRVQRYESNAALFPRFQLVEQSCHRAGLAASAAFLLAFVAGTVWLASPASPPPGENLIRHANQSEGQISTQAVHQRLTVEVIQETPVTLRRRWSVDVWSDEDNRRFALEWKQSDGLLEYALWRPDAARELVYRRTAGVVRAREERKNVSVFQLIASETDLDRLEQSLMRWLEGRRWRPIAFASDFAAFTNREGLMLSVREGRSTDGRRFFQISTRRQIHDRTVEALMEIDATTFKPHLLSIRLITPTRLLELRLIVEGVEPMDAAGLTSAFFEPDLPYARRSHVDRPEVPGRHFLPRSDRQREPASVVPSADWLESVELEIRYALHRARACLGEPVELGRKPAGGLSLQGVVSTERRKEELLRVLAALQAPAWVEIDIKSAEELVGRDEGLPPPGMSASVLSVSGREADLYFQQELEKYFKGTGAATPERLATTFINRAVSISNDLLTQAWALRRLAERYGADEWQGLRLQSRWLLQMMVHDHLRALGEQAEEGRLEVEPVLSAIGSPGKQGPGDSAAVTELPWDKAIFRLFDAVEQIRLHVTGLFAGAGLPVAVAEDARSVVIKSPQRTLDELLAAISSLEEKLQRTEAQSTEQFSARVLPPRR